MKPEFKQEKVNCNNTKKVNWHDLPWWLSWWKTDDNGGKSAIYPLRKGKQTGRTQYIQSSVLGFPE